MPAGLPPDRCFKVQYPVPKKADFMVIDESRNGKPVAAHMLPAYWTNVKIPDRLYGP